MSSTTRRVCALRHLDLLVLAVLAGVVASRRPLRAEDWPTYRHDSARSGVSGEQPEFPLAQSWVLQSYHRPRMAWPGPAKWDGWHKIYDLKDRMTFDRVLHVAVVGDAVFFCSPVDDRVSCVDLDTGKPRWVFYTEGPLRLAPTVARGRVYVGSDDGLVYCLRASDGALEWKSRAAPGDLRVPGNERIVSMWPVRTSVIVVDDMAYCGAGVFPREGVYLAAMNATTGAVVYRTKMNDLTAQGYMLGSATRLYVTAGRERPIVFDRATGKRLFQIAGGGGGTYALLTSDMLLYGPGQTGEVSAHGTNAKDQIASFRGNHMIVTPQRSYLHTDTTLSVLDRSKYVKLFGERQSFIARRSKIIKTIKKLKKADGTKNAGEIRKLEAERGQLAVEVSKKSAELRTCFGWKVRCDEPLSLILAGDTVIAGGRGAVAAYDGATGSRVWRALVSGNAFGLAAARGRIFVSTDTGAIHCFGKSGRKLARSPDPGPAASRRREEQRRVEKPAPAPTTGSGPLLHRWVFDRAHVTGSVVAPDAGSQAAEIDGDVQLVGESLGALVLDGNTSVTVTRDLATLDPPLPLKNFSVEAWVLLTRTLEWTGFVSAVQNQGVVPRGFLLGAKKGHMCFGLGSATATGPTFVVASSPLQERRWHHVVGTWDGATMRLHVDGILTASSTEQRGELSAEPAGSLELGIYLDGSKRFPCTGLLHEVSLYCEVLETPELRQRFTDKINRLPVPPREIFGPFSRIHGPFVRFLDPTTIEVTWRTENPVTSVVEFGTGPDALRRFTDVARRLEHRITIPDVEHESLYRIRIRGKDADGSEIVTALHDFDSTFNYAPFPLPDRPSPYPDDEWTRLFRETAHDILDTAGVRRGYCLVVGTSSGRLAYQLARQSDLQIVIVEPDAGNVEGARRALDSAGLHGHRVTVHHGRLDELSYGPYFASLIVSESMLRSGEFPAPARAIQRLVRPCGGTIYLGKWSTAPGPDLTPQDVTRWLGSERADGGRSAFVTARQNRGVFWTYRRGPLPGAGEWTHQYASPDNSSCNHDGRVRGNLGVLWWGRPGPRPMPDRGPRNPAPVSANGRLYVQGNRTLFGMDAYSGAILWNKQIPTLRRANIPRDSSNMVATANRLLVAMGDYCVGFDGQTGRRNLNLRVLEDPSGQPHEWGYLAEIAGTLVGSATRRDSKYIGDDGEWYEDFESKAIARVTSDYLFAFDIGAARNDATGESRTPRWVYRDGVIINSTITAADGVLYFIESRSEAARSSVTGQLFKEVQTDQHLVAISLESGTKIWERPVDFSRCEFTTYLASSQQTLIVTGSDRSRKFHTFAFEAGGGKLLWEHHVQAQKSHHSGQLAHPLLIDNRVYHNKHTYDLRTGKVLGVDPFDFHGCGVTSASARTIFRRFEFHGMWDLDTDTRTEFVGVRSGCWLSLIPSGGLLLAPETSAGCACTHSLQISMALVPMKDRETGER